MPAGRKMKRLAFPCEFTHHSVVVLHVAYVGRCVLQTLMEEKDSINRNGTDVRCSIESFRLTK